MTLADNEHFAEASKRGFDTLQQRLDVLELNVAVCEIADQLKVYANNQLVKGIQASGVQRIDDWREIGIVVLSVRIEENALSNKASCDGVPTDLPKQITESVVPY